jgi:hypothetical protein
VWPVFPYEHVEFIFKVSRPVDAMRVWLLAACSMEVSMALGVGKQRRHASCCCGMMSSTVAVFEGMEWKTEQKQAVPTCSKYNGK